MHTLYLVSVWIHILAVTVWVGGMFFLVLVVVPWLRGARQRFDVSSFLNETGTRFRTIGWICFGIVLVTGSLNLWFRGVRLSDFVRAEWLSSPFGRARYMNDEPWLGSRIVFGKTFQAVPASAHCCGVMSGQS